jgi:DNA-binding NarL/FixJ family response regulator
MPECTILTITGNEQFVTFLQRQLRDRGGAEGRLITARSFDEACSLLTTACPRLIVVHWNSHSGRYEELNRLLWMTTVLAPRAPVLVIADRYRTDQATKLYRMGVTEYVSRTHHLGKIGEILAGYLRQAPAPAQGSKGSVEVDPQQASRAWSPPASRASAARVV